MPKAVATLTWSVAHQAYAWSQQARGETLSPVLDSPAWLARLAEVPSFAFHGQSGSYTARQESRERGERYWYAYRRTGQQVRKKYLGKTADLTLARLEQVARLLEAEREPRDPVGARQADRLPASKPWSQPAPLVPEEPQELPALPSDPFSALLSTRLHVPRPPARLVPRTRLIERLAAGLAQPLILLSAPAGYGKTTLLAEFLADLRVPVAWLSLDEEDNDPLRFLTAVLAALASCDPTLGVSVRPFLASPRGLDLSAVFGLLSGEIAERGTDLLLVLDDCHLLSDAAIQQALARLVEHCPPNLHLVLATRADPHLPLSRLRARAQLCELRAADLQFADSEAHAFLLAALSRELSAATEATILTRMEGWVAGLQLSALSLQGRRSEAEVHAWLADAAGSQRHLVDYLVEEVLAQQSEAVQAFLLATSILESLSAGLAAAVTGAESQAESAALLSHLERANLFLFPLDERGEWYRYHPLWAAVLRVLLVHKHGDAAVRALYARASRWYEQQHMEAAAIDAALAAGEHARAAQLLEPLCPPLLQRGQYLLVRRWLSGLPPDEWHPRPLLCLAYAWALFLSGRLAAYQAPLVQAERLFAQQDNPAGVGMAAALRAVVAAYQEDGQQILAASRRALALLPATQLFERSLSMGTLAGGYWLTGQVEAARETLVAARPLHEQAGNVGTLLGDGLVLGQVLSAQGRLHEAAATYRQVREQAAERHRYAIDALIYRAGILYEWNALEEAEAELARALAEAEVSAGQMLLTPGLLAHATLTQARLAQARGEDAAGALFSQVVRLAEESHNPRALAHAQAAQVRWWLAQGELQRVHGFREAEAEYLEGEPTYQQERGALTLARVLIAEGSEALALRLLDGYRGLAHAQGRLSSVLRIRLLAALAEAHRGRTVPAVQHLEQALALAEPEGYVRLFLDEGPQLLPLLRLVLSRRLSQRRAHYVRQLLTLMEAEHPAPADSARGEQPLPMSRISGRELEVLRGLAEGLSTPQLAARLVVSPNTIKTQRESLYRKLDARTREQALAQAARLHLL